MKGICLCSGGLDSTLALIKLLEEGHEVTPMFVDYNQWSLEGELKALESLEDTILLGNREIHSIPIIEVNLDTREHLSVGSVWGRGLALAGLAAMWAYTHGNDFDFIALGNHKGDVGPDCKPGMFDEDLNHVLKVATKSKIGLVLPISELRTEDIGMQLGEHGIPFDLMYSCYWYPPCGYKSKSEKYRCPGCRRKTVAMLAAGITDEELLNFPNGKERTYQSSKAEKVEY